MMLMPPMSTLNRIVMILVVVVAITQILVLIFR
jgi:hypothetical protein